MRAARAKLTTAPKIEMARDAVLQELKNMSVDGQGWGENGVISMVPEPEFYKCALGRGVAEDQAMSVRTL
jgi:hypothetical protein